jgi:hypothetical protein
MKVGKKWDGIAVFVWRLFFWAVVVLVFLLFILTITSCSRGYGCPNAF